VKPASNRSRTENESARARILRAAAHLYTTQGFEGTSIREIAAAARVTKPLVHYHFGSKQELFSTLLRESIAGCRTAVNEAWDREPEPRARLRAVLKAQFDRAREAPEIVAFAHEALTTPGMLPVGFDYRSEGRGLFELYVRLIGDGQARGAFRSVEPRAVVVMAISTVAMYVMAVLAGNLPEIPTGIENTVFDLLMGGLEVGPVSGARAAAGPPRRVQAAGRAPSRSAARTRAVPSSKTR
jgi:AcrR family transcriptional regulator